MQKLKKRIDTYLKEHNYEEKLSYFYYKPDSKEELLYREEEIYLAASTIKVPVVMAWWDLIHANKVKEDTLLQYLERHYEESDEKALYDIIQINDYAALSLCMELAIVYSDNPSNHMMREYYKNYTGVSFREWYASFNKKKVADEFYHTNQTTASIMLEVMKTLYDKQELYTTLISNMKIAAKGRYIQSNNFDFEVAQKYGEYMQYEHTMAILYMDEPILVGIFTEMAGDEAKCAIKEISKIMAEYNQACLEG